MHLNPDHYLRTNAGRIFTAERNAAAWARLYADLSTELKERPRRVVMVIGVQGAGKSSWARKWASEPGGAIYVDSTFATVTRRSRIIEIAKAAGVEVSAVWVKVSLETALRRNKKRPVDEIVPDNAVENVFRIFEPPSLQEGFHEVVVVGEDAGAISLVDHQALLRRCSWEPCGQFRPVDIDAQVVDNRPRAKKKARPKMATHSRDRNYTASKIDKRQQQIEESVQRYLDLIETADRTSPTGFDVKTVRLYEKIARLRQQMRELAQIRKQLEKQPDNQLSMTDPDARSIAAR